MLNWQNNTKLRIFIRTICSVLIVTFSFSNIQQSQAQDFNVNQLPVPGIMVGISLPFAPLALKGLIVNLNKPLEFQFIVDTGRGPQDTAAVKDQANQLVKYFLAGLTIPEGDLWVNLSPYEKNRIVPDALGQTDLGRDLLAQDYILKQLTASLIYPEKDLGKEFWSKVYAKAQEQFGTTNIPVNTFNKVWILPNQAQVFENGNAAYVTKSTLKVMLDEDYLAKQKHQATQAVSISSQIVRQIILPEIEKEVNTGKNFAPLRQIYQALILAKWYKETIQNGLMDALYTNKRKVAGVNVNDPGVKEEIYRRYLKAYKKGTFNYIKEGPTPDGQVVPRKYFSGGITQMGTFPLLRIHDAAMLSDSLASEKGMYLLTVNCESQNKLSGDMSLDKAQSATGKKYSLSEVVKRMALGLMMAAPLFLTPHMAVGAQFSPQTNGTLQVTVEKHDTFGQILVDAGYKGPLWGANGHVNQLRGQVESQIPSKKINLIKPGYQFNISNPNFVAAPQHTTDQVNQQTGATQEEIKTLRQTNGDLNGQIKDLSARLEAANKQIDQLKAANGLVGEVGELQGKRDDLARQIAVLGSRQSQVQQELDRLQSDREKAQGEVTNLQNQKPSLQQEVKDLNTAVDQLNTQASQLRGQVTSLQSQITTLEGKIGQLNQQKSDLEKQLPSLRQQTGQGGVQPNVLTTPSIKDIWASYSLWQKIGLSLLALTGVGIIITAIIVWKRFRDFKSLGRKIIDLTRQKDDLERQRSEVEARLNATSVNLGQVEQAKREAQEARDEQARLQTEITRLRQEKQGLETWLADQDEEKRAMEGRIAALTTQEQDLRERTSALGRQESNLVQSSQSLSDQIDTKARDLKALEERIAAANQNNTTEMGQLDDLIRAKREELNRLEGEIRAATESSRDEQKGIEEQMGRTKGELEAITNEIANLRREKGEIEGLIQTAKGQKDQETRELERLRGEQNEIGQKITSARQTVAQLEEDRHNLEGNIAALNAQHQAALKGPTLPVLSKPYSVMIFDIDRTITGTTKPIDEKMLDELFSFLGAKEPVHIALVSMQGIEEIKKYIVQQVYSNPRYDKKLLKNLFLYSSGGAQCFSFDQNGNLKDKPLYDSLQNTAFETPKSQAEVENEIRRVLGAAVKVTDINDQRSPRRQGVISIDGVSNRADAMARLTDLFSHERNGWHLAPRQGGASTIHVMVGGVTKAKAVEHFLKITEQSLKQQIPAESIVFFGDSFYAGGLDTDVISAMPHGSHIVSVGRKQRDQELVNLQKSGVLFSEDLVGLRNVDAVKTILSKIRSSGKDIKSLFPGNNPAPSHPNGGPKNLLIALALMASTVIPLHIGHAQTTYSSSNTIQVDSRRENEINKLTAVFTDSNYANNITAINRAIDTINSSRINHPKIREALKWVLLEGRLPDNKYYPEVYKNAVIALLNFGSDGANTILEVLNNNNYPKIQPGIFEAISQFKQIDSRLITRMYEIVLNRRGWMDVNPNAYIPIINQQAGKALYKIEGKKALNRFVDALNDSYYLVKMGAADAILVIAQSQLDNPDADIISAVGRIVQLQLNQISGGDNSKTLSGEATKILKKMLSPMDKFFTSAEYSSNPQKIIMQAKILGILADFSYGPALVKAIVYRQPDGTFNKDIVVAGMEALAVRNNRYGGYGYSINSALYDVFTSENYQTSPGNLKVALGVIASKKIEDSRLFNAIVALALGPNEGGQYFPEVNKAAVDVLIQSGSQGLYALNSVFTGFNFDAKIAQLQLVIDTVADANLQNNPIQEQLIRIFLNKDHQSKALRLALINAFKKLNARSMSEKMFSLLSDTDEDIRKATEDALVSFKVPQDKVEKLMNDDNPLVRQSAREVLKGLYPQRYEEVTAPQAAVDLRSKILFHSNYDQTAQSLRDYYRDKPWFQKIPNYLLSYIGDFQIWITAILGIIGTITSLVIGGLYYGHKKKERAVYTMLKSFVGPLSLIEIGRFKKAARLIAKKSDFDADFDWRVREAIIENLPQVYEVTQNERIAKIALFLDKLKQAKVDASKVLQNGLPVLQQSAKDDGEFNKGLDIVWDTIQELQKHNMGADDLASNLNPIKSYITNFAVFEAICGLVKGLALKNIKIPEALSSVVPQALKTAKDDNSRIEKIYIILKLFSEGIYPTQFLIETIQKTTSAARQNQQIAQWYGFLKSFKSGAVKFDVNNPLHVDLEYTHFREIASQASQGTNYDNFKGLVQQLRSQADISTTLPTQEKAEVKIAVYEAFRLLEFVLAVKDQADKLGRPVWVVPNLSYGKFAVSPIIDELRKLKIEVHDAKVGSSGAHDHPDHVVPSLFTDEVYSRILKEKPILIVVDGTKHLQSRDGEGKSSRYPDAYVGYRNLSAAINEVISGGQPAQFLDKIHISEDFLGTLHQNSEYKTLVDKLKRLNISRGQQGDLYKLGFWNPAGLPLIIRQARKEVQKVDVIDPKDLDSPSLLFINSPLLDTDVPQDIKTWAGLEQPHVPAFFDDNLNNRNAVFAVGETGLFLTHSLDFETQQASQELRKSYKGRLPQVVFQPPTPQDLRSAYQAMLFDVDGTLTDTLSEIDKNLLNKLIYFLNSGVVIGIVTSQSIDEVKKHIIDKVDANSAKALRSLVVFTARGSQAWRFDQNNKPYVLYDRYAQMADGRKQLLRQVVRQSLGGLVSDAEITDRQAQITIQLKKNKDKRDSVDATLNQLIANNSLPFVTQFSGKSTIHVVMQGVDKGTAKDYFVNQILPQFGIGDVSKMLIVGDRFGDNGSDRPMIVPGARIVSVGKRDKNDIQGIEFYPQQGWRGTNQLLGDIITRTGKTTVTLNSFAPFFGLPALLQGADDNTQNYILAFGAAAAGIGLLYFSFTKGIKYYRTYKLYSQIKEALNFLDGKDSRRLYRAVANYAVSREIKDIDPQRMLVEILPGLALASDDKRLSEISDLASRLSKADIDPRHVYKYTLGAITSRTSDNDEIANSLGIVEKLALSLNKQRYNYHQILKEIMPTVSRTVRGIDELDETLLLAITLVNSGRNPVFAITQMLPEVVAQSTTLADFRLGIYALERLCLEGMEPTKYLLEELVKKGQTALIDQTIADWQQTRHKFKTGQAAFDSGNRLHVNLEYTTFRGYVDRTLKQPHKYSFSEYQDILRTAKNNNTTAQLRRTEKAEIRFAAYEAFRFREFVLKVKQQADKMGRKVWVVPNLSYGRFAVSPILKDLAADGVEIHYARIGSTESHNNALLIKPDLFSAALYGRIVNEQPVIIVVDGTQHLLSRPKDRKSGRYPDAYVGYRNMVIVVNDLISQNQEAIFKGLVKTDGSFIRELRKKTGYRTLRRRLSRLLDPNARIRRFFYDLEFWNPGGLELALRQNRKEVRRIRNVAPESIAQPTLIFVNSVMLHEDVPVFVREIIAPDNKLRHKPAYFDDTSHIQNLIFKVDGTGISLSDQIYDNIRKEYKRIRGMYQASYDIPLKPQNLPGLAYKAVLSDLDGTLANTLQEVPKPIMEKILYLLGLGIQVGIITVQSYKEVEKYVLSQVPAKYKALLSNLTIYPATGSQGFGFDVNGDPLPSALYDISDVKLSDYQMQTWRQIVNDLVKEYGLDKEVKDKLGKTVATTIALVDAGSQIILRLKERGFLRPEIYKRLQSSIALAGLPITIKEIGGTSIRMTLRGIGKARAVNYHLTQVCKAHFGLQPKPQEVLVLGNSFDENGDDRDMIIKGARVFSVGRKPQDDKLRTGISFYPESGWRGGNQLLAEFINAIAPNLKQAKKAAPQAPSQTDSLSPVSVMAAGGMLSANPDSHAGLVIGAVTIIAALLYLFKDKLWFFKKKAAMQDISRKFVPPLWPRRFIDLDKEARRIRKEFKGLKIGIIGATAPTREYAHEIGIELGKKLRAYLANQGYVFTGGVPGVGEDVYQGIVSESKGGDDRFFVLLPEGMSALRDYTDHSPAGKVRTVTFGQDMYDRRIGMGKVSDVLIVLNGRGGTLHEAAAALENGKKVIALDYGGAGSLLYQAKVTGVFPAILINEGIKQEFLKDVVIADLGNIEQVLNALTGNTIPVIEKPQHRIPSLIEVKRIFQDAIKVQPSDEDIVSVVGRNATSRWYSAVRRTINTVLRHPVTVYYPGPWRDITHPLLTTDGDVFMFVDIGESNMSINRLISSISGQILKLGGNITDKEIVNDTQAVLDFEYQGRERRLYYYNKIDASNPDTLPQKVKDGFDVFAEKVLSTGYTGAGTNKNEVLKVALPYLRKGGFLLTDYRVRSVVDDSRLNTVGIEYVKDKASPDWRRFLRVTYFSDEAQISQNELKDFAMTLFPLSELNNSASTQVPVLNKGGIDLNQINIKHSGKTISIQFDPAQLNAIEQSGFEGFTPIITNIIRIQDPLPLFGINDTGILAKGEKLPKDSLTL